ncbi:GTP-binding protein EsdC [Golovinomyces cichoracearum]|uniref:GTP-binding protein EsdC n=1 Tax=Golovinomyces cichoracearum TaxID=62708 RepID=A0A420IWH0_9PEZI|nr:GTP-binding protein EsdC [Golovinomyces cichoracearum]
MASLQLTFELRAVPGSKTVHLLGSWDNYTVQLPLSKSRASSRSGNWLGTYKFQNKTLQPGKRYWYYYIVDGHQIAYNPKKSSVTEPVTKQILNILDIPFEGTHQKLGSSRNPKSDTGKYSPAIICSLDKKTSNARRGSSRDYPGLTVDIPKGRPLSISKIKSPKPITPHLTKFILESDFSSTSIHEMTSLLSVASLESHRSNQSKSSGSSVFSYSGSSMSSRSDNDSPGSTCSLSDSDSSCSGSQCSCELYGITRQGGREKLDCGGMRCGYTDDSSSCSSSEDDSHSMSQRRYRRLVSSSKNSYPEEKFQKRKQ